MESCSTLLKQLDEEIDAKGKGKLVYYVVDDEGVEQKKELDLGTCLSC